jgi:methyl-accepting chemotaxis protein
MRCGLTIRILAMVLVVGAVAAGGLWAQHEISRRTQQEVRSIAAAEYAASDKARVMQVAFKTQVQEWKNLLLRGYNAERLAKHRAAMIAAGAEADRLAMELLTVAHEQERGLLESFRSSHDDLGKRYARALSQVEMAEEWDFKGGDVAVTGIDRKPNELCDGIVAAFTARARDRLDPSSTAVATKSSKSPE